MIAVAVDIGATKTHIAIIDNTSILVEKVVNTHLWRVRKHLDSNLNEEAYSLNQLIVSCLGTFGNADYLVIGCQGCNEDAQCYDYAKHLSQYFSGNILVLNDAELLLPAAGFIEGISVIAGTGSIVVSRDVHKKLMTAGGFGWYLGDEGGAVGLVREAAKHIRYAMDIKDFSDPLMGKLCEAYGCTHHKKAIGYHISELANADKIGQHVRVVFDAYHEDSKLAKKVIDHAALSLANHVCLLVKQGAVGNVIVTAGGVIARQEVFAKAFQNHIAETLAGWSVHALKEPPVMGAVHLARSIMANKPLGRFPNSYKIQ